eukprot:CAMPEP_0197714214 /NCGR_PEP_ID=MMETSP1338-20131121/130849_1 /TAXON_ID=43686 ORGANISM="Pelagodinium beii, Strain RCC1491" /NCGR_SAMPLE_ID=MMETSP1338 /ASSEMBLY_ACC=CAM_ASM_000754 /LENGTH=46 /DNA_ID= /DNA_START= /DNA_END= /DNA_ORIENTATION=
MTLLPPLFTCLQAVPISSILLSKSLASLLKAGAGLSSSGQPAGDAK